MSQSELLAGHLIDHPERNKEVLRTISFNDVCFLAAQSCGASAAVIISIDDTKQAIHSVFGLNKSKSLSWNEEMIQAVFQSNSEFLEILGDSFTCEEMQFSYLAGFKIFDGDNKPVGFLCIIDDVMTHLNPAFEASLKILAKQVTTNLINAKLQAYQDLIENVADIIYQMDGKGNYITVNSRFSRYSGYTTDELLAMNYQQLVHPDDFTDVQNYHRELMSEGKRAGYKEFRILNKKGDETWIGQNVTFHYKDGEVEKVSAVARNISDVRNLKDSLNESEQHYRLVTENSRDMTCLTKMDGTFLYVSPSSKDLIGYEPEELLGKNGYDYFHPDDFNRIKKESKFQNTFLSKAQYRFRKKDGSYLWVETVNRKIFEEGEASTFQSNTRDISRNREILQELEKNSAIMNSMMENTRDFIFAVDAANKFIYFNSAYRDIYERRTGQPPVIGEEFIFPEDNPGYYEDIFRKVIEGERVQVDISFSYVPGEDTHFEGYFNPITNRQGKPIGGAAFLRDVTDQKE